MRILGTGSALPKNIVSNDDLAQIMDTSDEWIRTRTGIETRHIAVEETTTSLSIAAAQSALEAANLQAEDIDLILASTVSGDNVIPMLSCEVQAALGAKKAVAFDLGVACSGFLFALATADAYFSTGRFKTALLIGAETLSKLMDWNDRGTCVLFGDGAGTAVVSAEANDIWGMVQGSDGTGGMALQCQNRPVRNPFKSKEHWDEAMRLPYVQMNGPEVYKFAVRTVPNAIQEALDQAGITADEVDCFVLHQANIRIIESVAKRLQQPMEKFPTNLQECGNISAASVPILLDKICKEDKIKKGDKIVLAGFGAGLTWGACVIGW